MAPRIPNIPPELVAQIIQHAYGSDTVASCLLVNREWHHFALQVLYKDLVLANIDQLERFLATHNDSLVRSFTRSLTIYVRDDGRPSVILQVRVDYALCRLAEEVIPHMSSLMSFSLTTDRRTFKWHLLRTTISAILIALPLSCVNLELDTDGKDEASFWPMPAYENRRRVEGVGHVCQVLRRIFHRMHNARIDLKSMCGEMFGTQWPGEEFDCINLPLIQHLLIETTGSCGRSPCPPAPSDTFSWAEMIRALGHVARKKGTAPGGRLSVLGKAFQGSEREKYYPMLLRCDMRGGEEGTTTLAFPGERFPRTNAIWGGLYTRTDKGGFMMRSVDSFFDIAGGRPWRTAASGARLPVSSFPDVTWLSDKDAGILTEEEWKKKFPGKSHTLWENEKTMGARLMNFEERKNYIELTKVREKLPHGFIREGQNIRPGRRRPLIPQSTLFNNS